MSCQRFEDVISELARGQMMDADMRREALDHAAECRLCMLRLGDEEKLSRGLQALKADMQSFAAPDALESRLLAAFRAPAVVHPIVPRRSSTRYWLSAVAALLLIVLGVMAMRWRVEEKAPAQLQAVSGGDEATKDVGRISNTEPESKAPEKRVLPKRKPNNFLATGRRSSKSNLAQNVVANHTTNEVATEFVPLGYMNAANFQDGGQIVRVELPRSALATFGFPVNMERYNEKVKADILLGVDGMAHAIRFVQ